MGTPLFMKKDLVSRDVGLKLVKYKCGLWVPYQAVMDCEKMRKIARISLNFREKVY